MARPRAPPATCTPARVPAAPPPPSLWVHITVTSTPDITASQLLLPQPALPFHWLPAQFISRAM